MGASCKIEIRLSITSSNKGQSFNKTLFINHQLLKERDQGSENFRRKRRLQVC